LVDPFKYQPIVGRFYTSALHLLLAFGESILPMNKRQIIDDIRRFNVNVQPQFLAQFDDAALKQYLEHLQSASRKHVRIGGWVRKQPKLRLVS